MTNNKIEEKYRILKTMVEEKISELNNIVEKQWGKNIIPFFEIDYNLSSVRRLGSAYYNLISGEKIMYLDLILLEEYKEEYIKEVVIHEYAHMVVFTMFPKLMNGRKKIRAHGREFKNICSWFGIEGKATSQVFKESMNKKQSNRNTFKWKYICNCESEHMLSTRRHNNIKKNNRVFTCKNCGEKITYKK